MTNLAPRDRSSSFSPARSLRERLSRMFARFGARGRPVGGRDLFIPAVDLTEQDDAYVLRVDLPGIREEDVDVRVDADDVLTVSGERHEERKRNVRGYEHTERIHGTFSRSVVLPRGVDPSRIECDLRKGVLEVRVPKVEAARARRLPLGRSERAPYEKPRVITAGW